MSLEYFDRENNPISQEEWMEKLEDDSYRWVKRTTLHDFTEISTIWLGLSHGSSPEGPLIFETLVTHEDSDEEEMYRYATEQKAIEHHEYLAGYQEEPRTPPSRWWQIMNED